MVAMIKQLVKCDKEFLGKMNKPEDFLGSIDALVEEPYYCRVCGEYLDSIMQIRDEFAKKYNLTSNTKSRVLFAAWLLFKQKQSVLYATIESVGAFCRKNRVDFEEVMEHMIPHPTYKKLYTNKWVRDNERNICKWIEGLNVLTTDLNSEQVILEGLDDKQNEAVRNIVSSPCSILQGNAGCGKTRTVCELIKLLLTHDIPVYAAAFTHKAKNCIAEKLANIPVSVSTVHSLISRIENEKVKPFSMFLILDEASMLDIDLLGWLASTLMSRHISTQVCFVGDYHQIQPVGRGEFFRMLVETGKNVNNLLKCYRTDNQDLEDNYMLLRNGMVPQTSEHFTNQVMLNDEGISKFLKKHIIDHHDEWKIICWQNIHIKMINKWVQEQLLLSRKIGPGNFRGLYENDKVVYCGDSDDPSITNATNGVVTSANNKSMTIEWDTGATKRYTKIADIQLRYAVTAHKAQGSEFDKVLVACYDIDKMKMCIDRRWLYTSITRGKEHVMMLATKKIDDFIKMDLKPVPISDMKI